MTLIDASVVVCTYNRARLLGTALDGLTALRTDGRFRYEIVVVDNGSTDDTGPVIEDAARRATVPIRHVREPRCGVACARNCGVRSARGKWIAFFDDDQIAEPDWLLELIGTAEQAQARYAAGAVRLLLPDTVLRELPPVCRRLLGESAPVDAPCRLHRKLSAGTGNLLVHRTVFEEIGEFDESLRAAGEDTDLNRRIRAAGIEGWFVPSAVVRHVVPDYRLREDYFRWTSLRNGMHLAHRERREWDRRVLPAVVAARLGQMIVHYLPWWVLGSVARSRRLRLGGRCQLWRAEGYLRLVFSWVTSSGGAQSGLAAELDFRGERELFSPRRSAEAI